jgi:alpha-ketoglutarate-dependent taurine dioxygenase
MHNRADDRGLLVIDSSNPVEEYLGSRNDAHPLHHDGVFLSVPEAILTLKCVRSADDGGTSLLASGKAGLDFLLREMPEEVPHLFAKDAVIMKRDNEHYTGPIFNISNNRIHFRFRYDTIAQISPSKKAKKAFDALVDFYRFKDNYMSIDIKENHMICLDNHDCLHGRTKYKGSRKMLRRNYDGNGSLKKDLFIGFVPDPVLWKNLEQKSLAA